MKHSRRRERFLHVTMLFLLPWGAFGHTTGLSTADLKFGTNGLEAELIMAAADWAAVLAKTTTSPPLDANSDGQISQEKVTAQLEHFKQLGANALAVEFDDQPVAAAVPRFSLDQKDNFHLLLSFAGARPKKLRVRSNILKDLPAKHLQFVAVHDLDVKALGNRMLDAQANSLEVAVPAMPGATSLVREPRVGTFGGFLFLGMKHIWTGYDHLLFLLERVLKLPQSAT